MNETLANVGLVVVFVLVGGLFAAAEIALVSLRDTQARALASRGKRGHTVAELNQDPNRFLAAVQVGVTLAGFCRPRSVARRCPTTSSRSSSAGASRTG